MASSDRLAPRRRTTCANPRMLRPPVPCLCIPCYEGSCGVEFGRSIGGPCARSLAHISTTRPSPQRPSRAPDDLCAPAFDPYDYGLPAPPARRDLRRRDVDADLKDWIVADDWPEHISVSEAEIDFYSRGGSATSSTNCSGRSNDAIRRLLLRPQSARLDGAAGRA
jgi:hypothetical protein